MKTAELLILTKYLKIDTQEAKHLLGTEMKKLLRLEG